MAKSFISTFNNYNKFIKLDFNQIELTSNHNDLNNYIKMFNEEGESISNLKRNENNIIIKGYSIELKGHKSKNI